MLIKKIQMENFRQYTKSEIEFSTDPDKNITLVMGDNGTGKTTLAQAFQWCLYAQTDFSIQEVVNRKVRDSLPPGGTAYVKVAIFVEYNGTEYYIERTQAFSKIQKRTEARRPALRITFKQNGETKYLDETDRFLIIKQMLPQELSKFFFFDGERIRVMSEEIDHGKSRDFKEAVSGLVGLTSMQNAIAHLKPAAGTSTVIGRYLHGGLIDFSGSGNAAQLSNQIENWEKEKEEKENRLNTVNEQIQSYQESIAECKAIIMTETPKLELRKEYETLEYQLEGLKARRIEKINRVVLSNLGTRIYDFIATAVIKQCEPELDKMKETKQDIPKGIDRTVLLNLLNRGKCICGEKLELGNSHYEAVYGLLDIVPPKTTGTMVKEMKQKNRNLKKRSEEFFEQFEEQIKDVKILASEIEEKEAEKTDMFNRLSDTGEGEKAKEKMRKLEKESSKLENERVEKTAKIQTIEKNIRENEKELAKIANSSKENQRYLRYLAYAEKLYDMFSKNYADLEEKTRKKLEEKINQIFPQIYDGGMKIQVDEKYNIKVLVDENDLAEEEVEKNQAQRYSVIFAFITSIIAMAKEKALVDGNMTKEEQEIFSEAEGYPLVMDAALSSFDKKRIGQLCSILPSIANQVVFFIKDTDGDVAEQHMKEKIGRKYLIHTVNGSKVESMIEEVEYV